MLRKQFGPCLIVIFGLLHMGSASAMTFEVQTSSAVATPGGSLTADIVVSGLGDFAAPSLGAFDLDLTFDDSLFSFSSATFGDPVLGNQLDLFGFGSINGAAPIGSVVNLFEVSLDLPSDLDDFQAGAFTLASVVFDVDQVGLGTFGLSLNYLADSLGLDPVDPNNPPTIIDASVAVEVVPVPAAVWLFGSGLIGLIGWSRRKKPQ